MKIYHSMKKISLYDKFRTINIITYLSIKKIFLSIPYSLMINQSKVFNSKVMLFSLNKFQFTI